MRGEAYHDGTTEETNMLPETNELLRRRRKMAVDAFELLRSYDLQPENRARTIRICR